MSRWFESSKRKRLGSSSWVSDACRGTAAGGISDGNTAVNADISRMAEAVVKRIVAIMPDQPWIVTPEIPLGRTLRSSGRCRRSRILPHRVQNLRILLFLTPDRTAVRHPQIDNHLPAAFRLPEAIDAIDTIIRLY